MRDWINRNLLLSFSLIAAVWIFFLYSGALNAPFVYDDRDQIVTNVALQSWHAVYSRFILAPVSFTTGFLGAGGSTYRPLFWISLAIDRHLWGADASGFHFTSLFLHWLNAVLIFQVLRKLRLSDLFSGIVALIWLGLPINSEAVAWISARAYLLSAAFLLFALITGLSYVRQRRWQLIPLFIAFALLGIFSHEQGVILIGLLLVAYLCGREANTRHWLVLGVLSMLVDILYFMTAHALGARASNGAPAFWSIGIEFWEYVRLIAGPVQMSIERSSVVPPNLVSPSSIIAWAGLIFLIATAILIRKRAPAVMVGIGLLLIGILPYCGFVHIYQGMAERFTYIASVGFVLAVVAGTTVLRIINKHILFGCLITWVAWSTWRLVTRLEDWEQPVALYRHSLNATPESPYLLDNLGVALRDNGDLEGAITALMSAAKLKPDYAEAFTTIADIYAAQGKIEDALVEYLKALSFYPDDPKTLLNYGVALQKSGNTSQAELQYRRVMQLRPRDSAAYVDLENLLIDENRFEDAIGMYKQAIEVNPNDVTAYFDMGVMFQQLGQEDTAVVFYKKVLQLSPGDPKTLLYLSNMKLR